MKVGWIGLGSTGTNMALSVLNAGHELLAYERGAGLEKVVQKGARTTSDYKEVVADCDMVGVCVFKDDQVRESLVDSGALASMRPNSTVAIHTTGSASFCRELGAIAPQGVSVLDACFSVSYDDAFNAALTLMVGGSSEVLEFVRPILSTYAGKIHLVGPLGSGQTLKLLNNLLFATNIKNTGDILAAAEIQGLDPVESAKVMQSASGGSFAGKMFCTYTREQVYEIVWGYFVKDLAAARAQAKENGADLSSFDAVIDFFK